MSIQKKLSLLKELRDSLDRSPDASSLLVREMGLQFQRCPDLADDSIISFLSTCTMMGDSYQDAFLGFDLLLPTDGMTFETEDLLGLSQFHHAYEVDEALQMPSDLDIVVDEEYHPKLQSPQTVSNLTGLLPLFFFQGEYILVDLRDIGESGLYLLEGRNALYFAPSLKCHLDDLIQGVTEMLYPLDSDGDLIFPSLWTQRSDLRKGLVKMDEFGEVIPV